MKKFFVLVALFGVSMASIGCGGEGAKKAEPTAPPAGDTKPAEGEKTP
ncbi:MAG: hypothetical protein U0836_08065 [Pirellulales bacterium]